MHLAGSEKETLRSLKPILQPRLPEIIDRFYSELVSSGVAHHFFPDQETVQRLKKAQIDYFEDVLEAKFDETYMERRRQVGRTHERIGLEPRWYIGAYCLYCDIIFPILREELDDAIKLEQAELALLKAFHLDMQLAMETYIERYSEQLVDARRTLEQKLWMEDRLLTFIMTEASDAIIGLDEHGRISTWSQGAQRLFGFKTLEIVDRSLREFIKDPKELDQLRADAAAEGSATIYATEWSNKDGHAITADANLTLLRNQRGETIGSTLILRDSTEIRRLASKLKNMEQIHAMTKITAGVAHEIRTPLGVMALTADMIANRVQQCLDERDPAAQEPVKVEVFEMLGDLQKEVDRLNEIVNHYLVLSRINRPKRSGTPLNRFLGEIMQEIRQRARREGIDFILKPQDEEIHVAIDVEQFRRLLFNLVDNSIYALGDEGAITIESQRKDGCAFIHVIDNGRGMPPEMLSKVFTAFETDRPGGTGLGLYLVREIVEAHDGHVYIESTVGRGTKVTIELPIDTSD